MKSTESNRSMSSSSKGTEMRVIVRCPNCGWRIFDKLSITSGILSIKCPNCKHVAKINLSLRKNIKYRLAAGI